jgi:hypothetical protein
MQHRGQTYGWPRIRAAAAPQIAGAARAQHKTDAPAFQSTAQAGAAQVVWFWWLSGQFPPSLQPTGEASLHRQPKYTTRENYILPDQWPKTA